MNTLAPTTMPRIATVDERYQSYNVEMLEVTGGKFWKPYGPELDALLKQPAPSASGDTPAGMNPGLYHYRPPIDLTNARLRKLAAALGPAYVRVSGTVGVVVCVTRSLVGTSNAKLVISRTKPSSISSAMVGRTATCFASLTRRHHRLSMTRFSDGCWPAPIPSANEK